MKILMRKSKVKKGNTKLFAESGIKLEYYRKQILDHLDSLEDGDVMEKAKSMPVGTIRDRKDGKRYIKINDKKWVPKYDSHSQGAKMAIARLKKRIAGAKDEHEMMQIILENRSRFEDKNGYPLPFVQELHNHIVEQQRIRDDNNQPANNKIIELTGDEQKKARSRKRSDVETTPNPYAQGDFPHEQALSTISPESSEMSSDFKKIQDKYQSAKSIEGDEDEVQIGKEILQGRWKLVEADTPTASHDEKTFQKTAGFPSNEDGSSINDRDYEHFDANKEAVWNVANDFDGRALKFDNPVVVTTDGIVISGNNRTMSSKLAANKGTDKKYIEALKKRAKKFGFTEDQVSEFKNPRVVFEVEQKGGYSTEQFAKFNESGKKEMGPTEKAAKVSKMIKPDTIEAVAEKINEFDTIGELYQNTNASRQIYTIFKDAGLIGENEAGRYFENGSLTDDGKTFIETALLGTVINETNLRGFNRPGCKSIRATLLRALIPLVENKGMSGYSVNNELNQAVDIAMQVAINKDKFKNVEEFSQQDNMFETLDPVAIELAKKLEGGQKSFAEFMDTMNGGLKIAANGEADIFLGGVESKEDILSRMLKVKVINKAVDRVFRLFGIRKSLTYSGHPLQGRSKVHGMHISVENKKGSERRGKDKDGHEWKCKMHHDYGYIRGTVGVDKDHLDCYVGPNPESEKVFIVNQNDPVTGKFDEQKVMLGFSSSAEAKQAYYNQYDRPGFFGDMIRMDINTFKKEAFDICNKGKPLCINKSGDTVEHYRKLILDHLDEIEESEVLEKAKKMEIGTTTTRKDGKKYRKTKNDKWVQVFDNAGKGAQVAISNIKKKIKEAKDTGSMMQIIMENKERFSDKNGKPLSFVNELYEYAQEKGKEADNKTEKETPTSKEKDKTETLKDKPMTLKDFDSFPQKASMIFDLGNSKYNVRTNEKNPITRGFPRFDEAEKHALSLVDGDKSVVFGYKDKRVEPVYQAGEQLLSDMKNGKEEVANTEPVKVTPETSFIPPEQFNAGEWAKRQFDQKATPDETGFDYILNNLGNDAESVKQAIKDTEDKLSAIKGKETEKIHRMRGEGESARYTPERKQLHSKIMRKLLRPDKLKSAVPPDGQKPTFMLLGGRGGSGKSWFKIDPKNPGGGIYDPNKYVILDADEIKKEIPEFDNWNAQEVHEESSDILEQMLAFCIKKGLNVVLDGTMKTAKSAISKVLRTASAGYRTEAHYMFCPPQEAAKRAIKRFKEGNFKGRYVPVNVVLGNTSNEDSFDLVKDYVDSWSFRDNFNKGDNDPPIIISEGEKKK
jgi:predicted ABC-type ATPase